MSFLWLWFWASMTKRQNQNGWTSTYSIRQGRFPQNWMPCWQLEPPVSFFPCGICIYPTFVHQSIELTHLPAVQRPFLPSARTQGSQCCFNLLTPSSSRIVGHSLAKSWAMSKAEESPVVVLGVPRKTPTPSWDKMAEGCHDFLGGWGVGVGGESTALC